jgi:hypothetical protein
MYAHKRGFVALISVIVISAVLLVLVFTLGIASFFNRFDTLDTESKRVSMALAEACASIAMLKLAQHPNYTPMSAGDCESVSDICGVRGATRICKICSVKQSIGGMYTIVTRSVFGSAYSNLQITGFLTAANFSVSSWRELAVNPIPTCTLP